MHDDDGLTRPARVLYVTDNITTGEPWACIRTISSNPAAPWVDLAVPAPRAHEVVTLINEAHAHLGAAISACAGGDPDWREPLNRIPRILARMRGRPEITDPEQKRPVRIARYARQYTIEAAVKHFSTPKKPIKASTVVRYMEDLDKAEAMDKNSG
jgi:hypothetical protein